MRFLPKRLAFWRRRRRPKTSFILVTEKPGAVREEDLRRAAKTDSVLVHPSVLAHLLQKSAAHPRNEVGALLLGRVDGRFLVVEDLTDAAEVGTAVNVHFTPADFEAAQARAKKGQCIVGWAHSHPTYGVFLSNTDLRFQGQGQGLFPDYVALVIDPFHKQGVEFGFYRNDSGQAVRVPHSYLIKEAKHAA